MTTERPFKVGDVVTRDGTDRQMVLASDPKWGTIEVECIVAPVTGWCAVGDTESNLARRYDLVARAA
jgi:hypothetical protein